MQGVFNFSGKKIAGISVLENDWEILYESDDRKVLIRLHPSMELYSIVLTDILPSFSDPVYLVWSAVVK
jgi:hypothetical protein